MTVGLGVDIVEIDEITSIISQEIGFKEKVYSRDEIEYCESAPNRMSHYAARFAAKEAFMKACGLGWSTTLQWKDIETISGRKGKPYLKLHGNAKQFVESKQITNIFISLSHSNHYAIATIILESAAI